MSVSCALLQQDDYTATAFQADDRVCSQSMAMEPVICRGCNKPHLDEYMIVKTKIENIWKGNAVQLLALKKW